MSTENKNFLDVVTVNCNIDINDVAVVFVAKYEDGLHNKLLGLQSQLKDLKLNYEQYKQQQIDSIIDQLDTNPVSASNPSVVSNITFDSVHFVDQSYCNKTGYRVTYNIKSILQLGHHTESSLRTIELTVDALPQDLAKRKQYEQEIKDLTSLIMTVNSELGDVSRKERAVRGRIAEARLQHAGYDELLQDPQLMQLIKID